MGVPKEHKPVRLRCKLVDGRPLEARVVCSCGWESVAADNDDELAASFGAHSYVAAMPEMIVERIV